MGRSRGPGAAERAGDAAAVSGGAKSVLGGGASTRSPVVPVYLFLGEGSPKTDCRKKLVPLF